MPRHLIIRGAALLALAGAALAEPTVTVTLESVQNGQTVSPGALINWTIKVAVSTGDNQGLALLCVDLVQNDANPAFLDLPPGEAASIDTAMDDFSRPLGISNPGEGAATTGYIGVQRGTEGQKNLVQIGGGQNTFGVAGPTGLGEDYSVEGGVGQGATPQLVLSGSFLAPAAGGTYTLELQNALANVLTAVNPPPQYSPVAAATVDLTGGSLSFTVQAAPQTGACCVGIVCTDDVSAANCATMGGIYKGDGSVCDPVPTACYGDADCSHTIDFDDINYFVAALAGGEAGWSGYYQSKHGGTLPPCTYWNCDADGSGGCSDPQAPQVDFDDINPFVAKLVAPPVCQ
jgi:hypothetical protein